MRVLRRRIARLRTLWLLLFVATVVAESTVLELPWLLGLALPVVLLAIAFVGPPRPDRDPVTTGPPVRGRWVAVNGPGSKVPSHGVRSYGQAYAVDVLHPSPAGARVGIGWGLGPGRPRRTRRSGSRCSPSRTAPWWPRPTGSATTAAGTPGRAWPG